MKVDFNINSIYYTLKKFGIDKNFIKDILLPDWWDDEIAKTKAGYLQTIDIISKNLGIDLASFLTNPDTISLKGNALIKFKTAKNISISDNLIWPKSLAIRISELIEEVYPIQFKSLPKNALEIRDQIVENSQKLNLDTLLDYLWDIGIPVLHISEFPKDVKKMDGMIINLTNRPIIIVSKNRKHDAWLLFIIAHELGHFIKGHLTKPDNIIYDADIEYEQDKEEKEANEFALELLTGSRSPKISISGSIDNSFKLFNVVSVIAKKMNIDPGVITLNFAYVTKKWALAEQTLKNLNPKADAVSKIHDKIRKNLNFNNTTKENTDFFIRIISLSGEGVASLS
ncbi:MAG: hypothetical protein A2315_00370 [Ignavibacteria bacterium RIFOXYB2_FULL_35_12]|nr:MAG: hypothetical protein A2058_12995 [Ignavibacteria bacterium GWA2_36_19]OGU53169.1 MAG: hypothetical protein A2006_07940 [Ignavibacteria bacterium GWC2_35_8]OGU61145.1 MAG: hypothetical protein A2X60_15090 [Ignavibacteria bacterium GWF2_35_20]OGU80878.1 MAG: hypothetical protein A2254_05495 [Ignavibacteria bacterium RIFOXYA2_FULL_35_9]OGU86965.1 MAG: hypothetical protein A3K31_00335 [Ignavibacteria bacterium RIFOXYA12_FULL_35_25]OGU94346.1 MAG: hypothetical protein A2347_12565 [Ignavibac